ncbi:hypothetical protein [Litorihabitans aurantiacus]
MSDTTTAQPEAPVEQTAGEATPARKARLGGGSGSARWSASCWPSSC